MNRLFNAADDWDADSENQNIFAVFSVVAFVAYRFKNQYDNNKKPNKDSAS
jgi:hypothetical protein